MRFRKYLGTHYQDKNNVYYDEASHQNVPLPIISLYFLGHKLEHTDAPVIKVNRQYIDLASKKELAVKEKFIESLSHDSYIIQIPQLRKKRRNNLEILLSIFDQSLTLSQDDHFLNLDEKDYPEEFRIIIRRLLKAAAEQEVCDTMDVEDDILDELQSMERKIYDKDKALEDKDKVIEDKDKVIEDKDKVIEDKDKVIKNAVDALVSSGLSLKEARETLGLPDSKEF